MICAPMLSSPPNCDKPSINLPRVVMAPSVSTIVFATEAKYPPATLSPHAMLSLTSALHPVHLCLDAN